MELVEKLLAYRKFKEVADRLHTLETQRLDWFARTVKPKIETTEEDLYFEASLYDLTQAFKNILRFITDDLEHHIESEGASIDEKIDFIESILANQDSIGWMEIFGAAKSKVDVVCSFLAILELCKMNRIRAQQSKSFGDIRLFRQEEDVAA